MRKLKQWKNHPLVTWGLLCINGIVFLIFLYLQFKMKDSALFSNDQAKSIAAMVLGAESQTLVWQNHDFYRLFTAMFVHFDVMHLLCNSVFLYAIGQVTETVIGHTRFFFLYIISGLFGDILAMVMPGIQLVAGASGALFGLMGMWSVIWLKYRKHPNCVLDDYGKEMFTLAVANIILNFMMSGVSMSGHIGGFIGGAVFGFFMLLFFKPKSIKIAERGIY